MKINKKYLIIAALSFFVAATYTGCAAMDKAVLDNHQTITAATTNAITGEVTAPMTNNVFTPKTSIENIIDQGKIYAPLVPAPYSFPIQAGLGLLSGALALYAKSRNNKLNTANQIVSAIVAGVESAGHAETKAAIQDKAVAAGVQDVLAPIVQNISQQMK